MVETNPVYYSSIGGFVFDPLHIKESGHFTEALEHLNKDISKYVFSDKFYGLEKKIITFNDGLKNFETEEIYEIISTYFESNGFKIITEPVIPKETNTVIVTLDLLRILKQWWLEDIPPSHRYDGCNLVINGSTTIAVIDENNKNRMIALLEQLQNYEQIIQKYQYFKELVQEIYKEWKEMQEDIKQIISKIEKREYNTICSECEKYIDGS